MGGSFEHGVERMPGRRVEREPSKRQEQQTAKPALRQCSTHVLAMMRASNGRNVSAGLVNMGECKHLVSLVVCRSWCGAVGRVPLATLVTTSATSYVWPGAHQGAAEDCVSRPSPTVAHVWAVRQCKNGTNFGSQHALPDPFLLGEEALPDSALAMKLQVSGGNQPRREKHSRQKRRLRHLWSDPKAKSAT